jgi:uncharacterized membrane protein (DUF4010 family)
MAVIAAWFAWNSRSSADASQVKLKFESPVSLVKVAKFANLFVAIEILETLATRLPGSAGLLIVSVFRGAVSSASTTAAANLGSHGRASPFQTAAATVVTSIVSAIANLPLMYRQPKTRPIFRRIAVATFLQFACGLIVLVSQSQL